MVVTVDHDAVGIFGKRGLQQACRLATLHALVGSRDAIGVGERNMEKEENRLVGVGGVELSQFVGHPLHRAQRVGVVPCVLEEIESAVEHHKILYMLYFYKVFRLLSLLQLLPFVFF